MHVPTFVAFVIRMSMPFLWASVTISSMINPSLAYVAVVLMSAGLFLKFGTRPRHVSNFMGTVVVSFGCNEISSTVTRR